MMRARLGIQCSCSLALWLVELLSDEHIVGDCLPFLQVLLGIHTYQRCDMAEYGFYRRRMLPKRTLRLVTIAEACEEARSNPGVSNVVVLPPEWGFRHRW